MILNKFVFPIKADLRFVEGGIPQGYLTANDINKDMFYVISPTVGDTIISANFQNNVLNEEPVKVEFIPSSLKVSELVSKNESYYELVKDWNVWQGFMPSKPLEYVAYNRAGEIGISFNFKQLLVPPIPHGLEVKGFVEQEDFVPTQDGVYVVKVASYEYGNVEFTYHDLLIKVGNDVIRKGAMTQSGNTGSVEYAVDPSVFESEYESIDPSLTESILSKLGENSADINRLRLKFNNYYTIEQVDGLILNTQAFTYDRDTIDNKDADTLQQAKAYTYSKQVIDDKDANKLDKIWNDITSQSSTNLNDEFVLNRGGAVYKTTLANMLSNVVPIDIFVVVSALPEVGLPNKIYLVSSEDPELQNTLDEFIWIENDWEMIGNVRVDLEDYYTINQVDVKLADLLNSSKAYTDNKDADTLQQAKDYTYSKVEIDNKDANTLQQAKDYTYSKVEIDNKDDNTLQQAKDYTYSKVEIDNKDTVIMNKANNLEEDITNIRDDISGITNLIKIDDTTITRNNNDELEVSTAVLDDIESRVPKNEFETFKTANTNKINAVDNGLQIQIDEMEFVVDITLVGNEIKVEYRDGDITYIPVNEAVESGYYDTNTKELVLELANGNEVRIPAEDIVAGLASVDYVDTALALKENKINKITELVGIPNNTQYMSAKLTNDLIIEARTEFNSMLDNKVDKNANITAGTHPKITYDEKGLVTGGGALVAGDIPNLNASKINAGEFDAARIPSLDASKINSGRLTANRLPTDTVYNAYLDTQLSTKADVDEVIRVDQKVDALETSKQDKLVAGTNITIDPITNVISASGGGGGEEFTQAEKIKLHGIEEGAEVNPYSKTQLDNMFDDKVDKNTNITALPQAYVKNADGTQGMRDFSALATPNTIVQRNALGQIIGADATTPTQLVTKNQLDNSIAGKLSIVSDVTTYEQVYAKSANGEQKMMGATPNGIAYTAVVRDYGGRASVWDPTQATHATNKRYVDGLVNAKQNKLIAGKNITIDENTNEISASGGIETVDWQDVENKPDLNLKLDKDFSILPAQTNPSLTDVLVLNRGTTVQKVTLGNLLSQVNNEIFEVVSVLPATGLANKIYLVPSSDPQTQNALDEYIWIDNAWEKIGSVSVDLSNYFNKTDINSMLEGKVDKVTGKGLSTNDLTNTLKSNYDTAYTHSQSTHAPSNAQKNSDITKAEIEAKLTGQITSHSHALPTHNHDDRYYTETEVDTKLVGKANATHTHTKSEITDFPTSMPPTAHSTDLLTSGTLGIARGGTGRTDGYAVGVVETRASVLTKIWTGTQAQYDAIGTKDANTLYFII